MVRMVRTGRVLRAGALAATLGFAMAGSAVLAQEATPSATLQTTGEVAHPAHIHTGTCDNLGDVVFPLANVGVPQSEDDQPIEGTPSSEAEAAMGEMAGAGGAIPAYVSITQLDVAIDDILAAEHAINVHESEENIDNYIACGEIGGVQHGDTLYFGLRPQNDSGYNGIGLISADGDGSVNVIVYLAQTGGMGMGGGTAESTPSS